MSVTSFYSIASRHYSGIELSFPSAAQIQIFPASDLTFPGINAVIKWPGERMFMNNENANKTNETNDANE